jgi:hypothetical protein
MGKGFGHLEGGGRARGRGGGGCKIGLPAGGEGGAGGATSSPDSSPLELLASWDLRPGDDLTCTGSVVLYNILIIVLYFFNIVFPFSSDSSASYNDDATRTTQLATGDDSASYQIRSEKL